MLAQMLFSTGADTTKTSKSASIVVLLYNEGQSYYTFGWLFDLILYVPVNIFSVILGRVFLGSWVESVLSKDECVFAQGYDPVRPVRLKPATLSLELSTLPLRDNHIYIPSLAKLVGHMGCT